MYKLKCDSLYFRKGSKSDQPVRFPALSEKIKRKKRGEI